jgi:hypothetical protein
MLLGGNFRNAQGRKGEEEENMKHREDSPGSGKES